MGNVSEGFYSVLTTDQTPGSLYAMVNGNIVNTRANTYQSDGKTPLPLPIVVYTIVDAPNLPTFSKDALKDFFQVDCNCDIRNGLSAAWAIYYKLESVLNRVKISIDNHPGGNIMLYQRGKEMDAEDPNTIRIVSIWKVQAS